MNSPVAEYVEALLASERLGRQVRHHRLLPGREAAFAAPRRPWASAIGELLAARGVEALYAHQALAADLLRAGRHVVVATPTASGKTFCFQLPVIEAALQNPDSRALAVYPLKALAQDQLRGFTELTGGLPEPSRPSAAIYDGDTKPSQRAKIRKRPPNLLLTNPEMLHLSLLPHHGAWAQVLANLTHVVLDEVHTYRGVLGAHMSQVLRRLMRLCRHYGSDPCFVFCSATVGNPAELCRQLTGLDAMPVTESAAPSGARHMIFLNPEDSPASAAIQLLQAALSRGLKTIVYAKSRRMTELIALWAGDKSGRFKDRISAYRAGFLPEERREIEARMASGDLLAVISTSALELGIDIGGLDLCILVGYPGSVMATLQRGGRVGRAMRESAVVLVAQEDALDQHFMRHPEDFFARPPENAVLNPANPVILPRHMVCAAAELPLDLSRGGESYLDGPGARQALASLLASGELLESADGREVLSPRKRPHHNVDLRGAGSQISIEDADTGEVIGAVDSLRARRETHPGAVYLHRGRSYLVHSLDIPGATVKARAARVGFSTRVRSSKDTEILEILGRRELLGTRVSLARLKVTEHITGYEKRSTRGGELLGMVALDMPPSVFETEGIWFDVPDEARRAAEAEYLHFMGGIHAVEHAAIGILPLLVLTDRNDLGGISTPMHPQTGGAAVFIYDAMPGGAGLAREAFNRAEELLARTLAVVTDCPCELGCPSCVHSPKCGSGNRPIDKAAARFLLQELCCGAPGEDRPPSITPTPKEEDAMPEQATQPGAPAVVTPRRYGVLDVETRRSAAEAGGWTRPDLMGVSVAVLYDSGPDEFIDYAQEDIPALAERLKSFDLVVGFNIIRFDYGVLAGVHPFAYRRLPTLDMLAHVHERLGYRLKLDNLAQATLNVGKSADGLQALQWWKEGRVDEIARYCRQDVAVTRDLYLFGREHRYVLFQNKAGQKARLPVDW
ncbi:DEAD/DEAH box helicase domain-containing protein [Humidesulfovibrio mexicanus]|uniref:DEAD/DEAH box helicase domain-containing protein n=1 Tax=Humidesulfovibrio mexicanus TaxID=147047 RepID=A0A239A8V2_9BACT|nr:DEAD/DEAH box helicase [Humidesulfovibrio mexicanus]SNR91484.1 DEAD/DEAH box helicase domain-containing protein [Humidesulfovibrio mexicanus]